jgi:tetratricopeptide (TPR) repeat protein
MSGRRLLAALAGVLLLGSALAAAEPAPYDYAARQRKAKELRQARDYAGALYQSVWLAWLAPQRYRVAAEPALRDRELRQRAHRAAADEPMQQILDAALEASQSISDTCLNGAIAQQTGRLEEDVSALVKQAESARSALNADDPLARLALAQLYLSWDDLLRLRHDPGRDQDRRYLLRRAAGAVEAAARTLPQAPGIYRTEAIVRARFAEIGSDRDQWSEAIAAATRAAELDPDNASLYDLLWGLNLRAGRWDDAARWRERCRQATSP